MAALTLRRFISSPSSFVDMPSPDRAEVLLQYISACPRELPDLNERDWLAEFPGEYMRYVPFKRAWDAAMEWLTERALIEHDGWRSVHITKRGVEFAQSTLGASWLLRRETIDAELHDEIVGAWERADFTRAVGNAFLTVELRVRRLARVTDERIDPGDLMAREFNDGGKLRIPRQPDSQAKAVRMLFQGAMLRFCNPHLHGSEPVSTAAEAVRLIQFADLLLTIAAEHAAGASSRS